MCKDCGEKDKTHGPRCIDCNRTYKKLAARAIRNKHRQELAKQNDMLVHKGRKVCGRCRKLRHLSEFSTSLENRQGKLNKLCDSCLSGMYLVQGKLNKKLDYKFWRRRAYSLNTTARNRLSRLRNVDVSLSDMSYVFKPQDLISKFNEQEGKCHYCKVEVGSCNMAMDHVIPLSRGGSHSESNVVIACKDCNQLKSTRTDKEFLEFVQTYIQRFAK